MQMSSPTLSHARSAAFVEPDWRAPIDCAREVSRIPEDATISGMFLAPMVEKAEALGAPLPSARQRYTRFNFYPLREHVQLMFEAAERFFPRMPMRQALRKLGRGGTPALLESTLGRVVFSTAVTPIDAIVAMAKAYGINLRPGRAQVLEHGDGYAIVELEEIHYLLDTNHVGCFENVLRSLEKRAGVRIHVLGRGRAELLVTWDG
ncbi:MAG: DUF2378 family protein [Myxococcales bacterium]|nr:DUF2378 family protein [Myxococcales bacterium]